MIENLVKSDIVNNYMNTILVTGSEGNIGTYLVKYLERARLDFRVIRVKLKDKEDDAEKNGDIYFGNLSDSIFVQKIFQENKIDYVIHLASRNYNINDLKNNAYEIYGNDTKCLLNVLDNCKNIKKFVYFSSALIYESSSEPNLEENLTDLILPPKSSLGSAKYFGERAVEFFHQQYGVPYTIWRPFNVVSPLESHEREGGHVFIDFYRKIFIERSRKIQIYGTGRQVKCFIWVEDLVSAISDFLDNPKTDNQIFNIAGQEQKTLIDLAETLIKIGKDKSVLLKNYNPEIVPEKEFLSGKEQQKIPNTEKMKNVFGWECNTSFNDCFEKFIEYKQKI